MLDLESKPLGHCKYPFPLQKLGPFSIAVELDVIVFPLVASQSYSAM
jgi:hypothetical protein